MSCGGCHRFSGPVQGDAAAEVEEDRGRGGGGGAQALDTLRIRLQQPPRPVSPGITAARVTRPPSAVALLRGILRAEGPSALYRGMGAPLASVAFQVSQPVLGT